MQDQPKSWDNYIIICTYIIKVKEWLNKNGTFLQVFDYDIPSNLLFFIAQSWIIKLSL